MRSSFEYIKNRAKWEAATRYADDNNAENFLSFELESIAKNAIWLAKKKYMQNIVWKDPDIHYEDLSKISAKGFEIIQSSTPLFAREKLKDLLTYIFSVDKLDMKEFAALLKDIKRQFKLANIDQVSFSRKVNNYQRYIVNDYETFKRAHAERNVLKVLEGDCETAVGAHAIIDGDKITLEAELFSLEGNQRFYEKKSSKIENAKELGKEVGQILKKKSNNSYKK